MYCTSCTTWTVRVKIIIWEKSCLEARVNDTCPVILTSNLPSTLMTCYYISQVKPADFFVRLCFQWPL